MRKIKKGLFIHEVNIRNEGKSDYRELKNAEEML